MKAWILRELRKKKPDPDLVAILVLIGLLVARVSFWMYWVILAVQYCWSFLRYAFPS